MRIHDPVGSAVAVGFMALGGYLIASTGTMTPMGSVFPIAISTAMIVFAAILLVRNVVLGLSGREREVARSDEAPVQGGSSWRRLALVAAMAVWIALIPVAGFLAASVLGYFAVMVVATHERVSPGGSLCSSPWALPSSPASRF